jgi:hypothetical protein
MRSAISEVSEARFSEVASDKFTRRSDKFTRRPPAEVPPAFKTPYFLLPT